MSADQRFALGLLRDALRGTVHSLRPTSDADGTPRTAVAVLSGRLGNEPRARLRAEGFDLALARETEVDGLALEVYAVEYAGVPV